MIDASMRLLRRNQFLRFLVAGAINTLFGFIVYSAAILSGAAVWLALLLGLACGMIFNFFSTGGYVFRNLKLARVPRFVTCYILVYVTNLKLIDWVSQSVGNPIVAQGIVTVPVALFTYVLMARVVFGRDQGQPS